MYNFVLQLLYLSDEAGNSFIDFFFPFSSHHLAKLAL